MSGVRCGGVLVGLLALLAPALAAGAAPAASRSDPCVRAVEGGPSQALLATLGVLRRPARARDRPPRWVRSRYGAAYPGAVRFAPVATGGGVWVVPIQDVSDRFVPTEACIRTMPRRLRDAARRRKLRDLRRRPVEGVDILPVDAEGRSDGGAGSPGTEAIRARGMTHMTGTDRDRATLVRGLVPDGVAHVRVTIRAFTDERGRAQPAREATVAVVDNVFGVRIPSPFDFETPDEPEIVWLDAAVAPAGPASA